MRVKRLASRAALGATAAVLLACTEHREVAAPTSAALAPPRSLAELEQASPEMADRGRHIFRHWTFGDEQFWTDALHLNQVVERAVSPATALAVGLKVDATRRGIRRTSTTAARPA